MSVRQPLLAQPTPLNCYSKFYQSVKKGKIKIPVSREVQAPLLSGQGGGWGGGGAVSVETVESSETVENTWTYRVRSVV